MSLFSNIEQEIKKAMIAKDETRLSVVRFLKSALKYAAIEKKTDTLPDADVQLIIQRQIKQRRESIEQFKNAGRQDLVQKETAELIVLESFLPAQMDDAGLEALIKSEINLQGTVSKKDFGRMMKVINEKLAGRADARRVSEVLGKHLN